MKRGVFLAAVVILSACRTAVRLPAPVAAAAPEVPRNVLADLPHPRVDYWVDRFSRGDKRPEIVAAFGRKAAVETMITDKLRQHDMPEDLIYLAMEESGFNPAAGSRAGATGIWQLMPDTARQYGLRVDETVDERRDPEKATDAAIAFLNHLYNRFGSWYLAAAAYNAGEGRVSSIMTAATGKENGTDADYYRIWDQLPGETRDFIPAMIALRTLGRDPARYGFGPTTAG